MCIEKEDCPWYLHQRDDDKKVWECSPYKCSLETEAIVTEYDKKINKYKCVKDVDEANWYKVEHYELMVGGSSCSLTKKAKRFGLEVTECVDLCVNASDTSSNSKMVQLDNKCVYVCPQEYCLNVSTNVCQKINQDTYYYIDDFRQICGELHKGKCKLEIEENIGKLCAEKCPGHIAINASFKCKNKPEPG